MAHINKARVQRLEHWRLALTALLALGLGACAASPSPNPTGPSNQPPYPVLMTESAARREATLSAWSKFTTEQGITNSAAPELQPVIGTIRSLPELPGRLLYLPKVGDTTPMNEEDTRESLRRFIASASPWLGAQPQHLSLVQRVDAADGTKSAHYEQRPFRYPLRNGFGKLEIGFAPDRRVLRINCTCIPDVEQLRSAAAGTRPKFEPDKVAEQIAGRTLTYSDALGNPQTLTLGQNEEILLRELVIYPRPRPNDPSTLEFHLAWEITLNRASGSLNIYLDAVTNEVVNISRVS